MNEDWRVERRRSGEGDKEAGGRIRGKRRGEGQSEAQSCKGIIL